MKTKKSIRERVTVDIFRIWDNEGAEFAVRELMKLYYQEYNRLSIFEEKRLILYNLICAEADCENMQESVRIHSEQLKTDMDNEEDYKADFPKMYAQMLTFYRDSNINNLNYSEIENINTFCYNTYKECKNKNDKYFLDMLIAKFNLNLFNKNFSIVLDVIRTMLIHNTNNEYEITLKQMYNDMKNTNEELYGEAILLKEDFKVQII